MRGEEESLEKKLSLGIMALIIINAILGLAVIFLRLGDPLAVVNYFIFCLISYFYYLNKKVIYIPFFIFEFFTFSILLIDGLLPNGIVDSSNDFQNNYKRKHRQWTIKSPLAFFFKKFHYFIRNILNEIT